MTKIGIALVSVLVVGLLGTAAPVVAEAPGSVLFEDDFSEDTGDWLLFSDQEGSATCENGWLHVRDNPAGLACACYLTGVQFDDFVLEVDTKLVDGSNYNWHTITARDGGGELANYYRFDIGSDGTYDIAKWVDDVLTILADGSSNRVRPGRGATNHIRVECVGSYLSLSVNGHLLAEVSDSSHIAGDIALGCDAPQTSSEVAFDNLVVSAP